MPSLLHASPQDDPDVLGGENALLCLPFKIDQAAAANFDMNRQVLTVDMPLLQHYGTYRASGAGYGCVRILRLDFLTVTILKILTENNIPSRFLAQ